MNITSLIPFGFGFVRLCSWLCGAVAMDDTRTLGLVGQMCLRAGAATCLVLVDTRLEQAAVERAARDNGFADGRMVGVADDRLGRGSGIQLPDGISKVSSQFSNSP